MAKRSLLTMGKPIKFMPAEKAVNLKNLLKDAADSQLHKGQGFYADLIKTGQLQVDEYADTSRGPMSLLKLAHEYKSEPLALALLDNEAFLREFDTQICFLSATWSIPVLERISEIKGSVSRALTTEKSLNTWVIDYVDEPVLGWFARQGMSLNSGVDREHVFIPLHRVANRLESGRFEMLLRMGADPYITDAAGNSCLHIAVDGGMKPSDEFRDSPERAEEFRNFLAACNDHGLDLDRPDSTGMTALHLAARLGYANMAVELIRAGADPHRTDHRNKTPLDLAKASRRREAAAVFSAVRARKTILETVLRAPAARSRNGSIKE